MFKKKLLKYQSSRYLNKLIMLLLIHFMIHHQSACEVIALKNKLNSSHYTIDTYVKTALCILRVQFGVPPLPSRGPNYSNSPLNNMISFLLMPPHDVRTLKTFEVYPVR